MKVHADVNLHQHAQKQRPLEYDAEIRRGGSAASSPGAQRWARRKTRRSKCKAPPLGRATQRVNTHTFGPGDPETECGPALAPKPGAKMWQCACRSAGKLHARKAATGSISHRRNCSSTVAAPRER